MKSALGLSGKSLLAITTLFLIFSWTAPGVLNAKKTSIAGQLRNLILGVHLFCVPLLFIINIKVMIGFIVWIVGLLLTIKAALEIWRLNGDTAKKLLFIILILLTSWIGLIFYYFFGKEKMPQWVK